MRKLIFALALGALLAACAGKGGQEIATWGYKQNPAKSEAMNIAIGVGLTDAENGLLHDEVPINNASHGERGDAATVIEAGSYVAAGGAGLLGSSAVGVGIASALLSSPKHKPETTSHLYAFLPLEQARTGEEAEALLNSMVASAIRHVAKKQGLSMGKVPAFVGKGEINILIGKGCDRATIVCPVSEASFNYDPTRIMNNSALAGGIALDKSPYFVGGKAAWFFKGYLPVNMVRKSGDGSRESVSFSATGINEAEFYRDLSEALPNWFFAYTPHGESDKPAFYNAGRTLLFVKPDSQQAQK